MYFLLQPPLNLFNLNPVMARFRMLKYFPRGRNQVSVGAVYRHTFRQIFWSSLETIHTIRQTERQLRKLLHFRTGGVLVQFINPVCLDLITGNIFMLRSLASLFASVASRRKSPVNVECDQSSSSETARKLEG